MKPFALVILFLVSSLSFSQVKKPLDEFGKVTCEDLLARIDQLHVQMQNNPAAIAAVVLNAPQSGADRSPSYRRLVQKTFQRNGYDYERLRLYRRPASDLGGSMWLLMPGEELTLPNLEVWPDPPLNLSRPFIWDTYEDDGVCPTFAPRAYAEILKAHGDLRGRIVVHAANRREALASGTNWIKELTGRWRVPRNRLKLIIGKQDKVWFNMEFWLIPTKKSLT